MTHPRWEHLLLDPVACYLGRKGFRLQQPEVRFFDQRIDLYAFSEADNVTLAVELKLHRWRYALRQALLYQLCADYAYVALPAAKVTSVKADLFTGYGIGLVAVDLDMHCRQVIQAKHSTVMRQRYRLAYIRQLRRGK